MVHVTWGEPNEGLAQLDVRLRHILYQHTWREIMNVKPEIVLGSVGKLPILKVGRPSRPTTGQRPVPPKVFRQSLIHHPPSFVMGAGAIQGCYLICRTPPSAVNCLVMAVSKHSAPRVAAHRDRKLI